MGIYVISKSPKGKYRADLFTKRGELILSSQMYMARKGALKGIRSIAKNAPKAPVEDQTRENTEEFTVPKFVIYKDRDKKFYFELIANNGKAVGTSRAYPNLAKAKAGIKNVKANAKSDYEKNTVTKEKKS